MNQQCKVCGEPAAGFHFGAFTCEGCKSFFGRSYNNLSSISECKNNGECIINKKNRTACKACRLRKCLLVGMSKSGSRYGRRSNWFKIHCLLQEQQQQAQAVAHQNGLQKPPALSPNSLNLMRHPSYSTSLFNRPPCTKEELMMLRLDEFAKHPTAASSPSISSPDSHNSDSSIEIGDKRNSMISKHNKHTPSSLQPSSQLALNKDLFLPLSFPGFPLMPPPGFLPPPTHFLFSSYHNALYEQNHHLLQQQVQQGLLKTSDIPMHFSAKSPINENDENDEEIDIDDHRERSGRNFSEMSLEAQRNHMMTNLPKRSNSPCLQVNGSRKSMEDDDDDNDDIEMNNSDEVLTPPRSPKSPKRALVENNPIDLSMKGGSSTKSDDINHNYYRDKINNKFPSGERINGHSDSDSNDHKTNILCHDDLKDGHKRKHSQQINRVSESEDYGHNGCASDDRSDDVEELEKELKRRKLHLTTPLDLSTKA